MKTVIKTIFFAIVISSCIPNIIEADSIESPPSGRAFYMVLANEVSTAYGISAPMVKTVLKHESNYNSAAVGDHGLAHGVAQFHKQTFDYYEAFYYKSSGQHLNYDSSEDQIKLMCWMWKNYPKTKNLWSTYRKYCDKL